MPTQVFDQIKCNRLVLQNGKSVVIELACAKNAGAQFNFIRRDEEGNLVNVLAIDVALQGDPAVRITDPKTGKLVAATLIPLIVQPENPEPPIIE